MIGRLVSADVSPRRGVVAGASSATYMLRAYMYDAMVQHVAGHSAVWVLVRVDDISQSSTECTDAEVADNLCCSAAALAVRFETVLELLAVCWGPSTSRRPNCAPFWGRPGCLLGSFSQPEA